MDPTSNRMRVVGKNKRRDTRRSSSGEMHTSGRRPSPGLGRGCEFFLSGFFAGRRAAGRVHLDSSFDTCEGRKGTPFAVPPTHSVCPSSSHGNSPATRVYPVAFAHPNWPSPPVDSDPTSAQFWPAIPRAGANRSVYLIDIPPSASLEDLCDVVRGGRLQAVSLHNIDGRRTGLVTFIRPLAALAFYERSISHGLTLFDHPLQLEWVKRYVVPSPRRAAALAAAVRSGASRSIRIEKEPNLKLDYFTEQALRADFGAFGGLERVEVLKDKQCAVVHFTDIWNAIKAIKEIKTRPEYALLNITYGEDRCAGPLPPPSAPLPGSVA
ncbi:hypothetical protein C8F04DRAFT_1126660 [Mycena alexandri]|uniref:RRM domain-containing protein n=1 Tax=Mycena alexandri TaxID=1745969 RepID=A0AAD6WUT6_9AGAR|nr:hypothetical protein C8F04DRAFT_1126660 [Mycena alexandri]